MDLPFVKRPIPQTGDVEIIRDEVAEHFKDSKIAQHGGRLFRLHGQTHALTITADDALWIIEEMGLGASLSLPMRRVVIWSNADKASPEVE